jgi:hypothetical protein
MAAPSSGNRPPKPVKLNTAKLFVVTLLLIATLLSLLALKLSLHLVTSTQTNVPKELKATVQITETDFLDTSGKYEKDRVYCMIPFIWNPKIYDASE